MSQQALLDWWKRLRESWKESVVRFLSSLIRSGLDDVFANVDVNNQIIETLPGTHIINGLEWQCWCFSIIRLWTTDPTKAGFYDKLCNESSTKTLHCSPFHICHPPLPRSSSSCPYPPPDYLNSPGYGYTHCACTLLYLYIDRPFGIASALKDTKK